MLNKRLPHVPNTKQLRCR